MSNPVVFCFGMGCDSLATLVELLENESVRNFPLSSLVVLIAQTGIEHKETKRLVETHLFPLLRRHRIRVVQVARAGYSEKDGIRVLSDTRSPTTLHTEGAYTLLQQCLERGLLPQYAGARLCSLRFKGWVLNLWIEAEYGHPVRTIICFNSCEQRRQKKAELAKVEHMAWYPAIEWRWSRAMTEAKSAAFAGEPWIRSCCTICPFSISAGTRDEILRRFLLDPAEAVSGLRIEFNAASFNPRQYLFKGKAFRRLLEESGNWAAIEEFEKHLRCTEWGLYEVRKLYPFASKQPRRSVRRLLVGSRKETLSQLSRLAVINGAQVEPMAYASDQVFLRRRVGFGPEHLLTAIPADPLPLIENPSFDKWWAAACQRPLGVL